MSKKDDQARPGATLDGSSLATDDTIDIDLDALPLPPAAERLPLDEPDEDPASRGGATDTGDLPPPPLIAGRYAPLSMVGRGATGRVYRVHDQQLDEVIALKLVREELLDDESVGGRFRREVKLARRVTHPNVARTFDIGEHNGQPFTTMEFIDGPVLTEVIAREAPLSPRRVVEIGRMLCAGLGAAHAAGIVHRDLKPDNILLRSTGEAVITDFGIARAFLGDGEQSGRAFLGTPAYMAPEQVEGRGVIDGRADIYALGLIFYEMLAGEPVWTGPSPIAVATARLDHEPPDPGAIPDLGWPLIDLLRRCMSRDPDARPSSVQAIDDILAGLTSVTRPMAAIKPSARGGARPLPTISRPMATLLAARRETVAVMPFAADELDAYLLEGLAEDIVDVLSMTPGLQVRPLATSRRLPTRDPLEAGRILGVAMVVTGQVSRRGDGLRIRAAVLSVDDGFQLWGGRFACAPPELPTIADVIAVAVAEALTVSPRPEATHLAMPADGRATDAFLRGRRHLRRLWHEDVQGAIDVLDEGLQWAPDDIRLLSAGAVARARMAFLGNSPRDAAALVEAAAMAAHARQIAPDRPEPYHAGAMVYFCQGSAAQAVPLLVKALDRAPGDFWIRDLMGRVLLEIGPIGAARKHLEAALALDGQAYNTRWDLARAHAFVNDWIGVDALLALPVDGRPDAWVRTGVRSRLDVWREDPRWVNEPLPQGSGGVMEPIIRLLRATSVEGPAPHHGQQMRRHAEQARSVAPRRALLLYQFAAESAARIGDRPAVMAHVADAEALGLSDVVWLQRCPVLRPYASDPGYQALKARVARRAGQIPSPGSA